MDKTTHRHGLHELFAHQYDIQMDAHYSEQTETLIRSWASKGLLLQREFLPLMSPIGKFEWKSVERQTLSYLVPACARSTESALLLIAYGQLWDAEVLVRSVAEGTLKFCYLLQHRNSFEVRHKEYSHDLWRISLLKDHQKAELFLSALSDPDAPEWKPVRDRLLTQDQRFEITRDYPKAQRRALDSRWGFTGLIGELSRSGDNPFRSFAGFAHGYSLASHIHHADYVGTSLPADRDRRTPERRNSIQLAHAARLVTDCFSYLRLRLLTGYRFISENPKPLEKAWEKVDQLYQEFDAAHDAWMTAEYPQHE